ncbi:MAG: hypothetical protein RLZZ342_344 [Candidatus Parcubacteria bacterium]
MLHVVRRHKRKILFTHSVVVFTLLASSAVTFDTGSTTLFLAPRGDTALAIGQTTDVDVMLTTQTPINALSVTLSFPTDMIEIVGMSKERSFLTLWTEETVIREDSGEIHFSGGTTEHGGITGSTTALTISVRAKHPGSAQIYFKEAHVLASDGHGTTVESVGTPFTYHIQTPTLSGGGGTNQAPLPPVSHSPDINGDGFVSLADISILLMGIEKPYEARLDLNNDGSISIADLSVSLAHMR